MSTSTTRKQKMLDELKARKERINNEINRIKQLLETDDTIEHVSLNIDFKIEKYHYTNDYLSLKIQEKITRVTTE